MHFLRTAILLTAVKVPFKSCLRALADVETKAEGSTMIGHHWD